MNVIFIWDLSLHAKAFYFFQSVSESQSFQTTVGEWQKPFWELDAVGQGDLCKTMGKPGGFKGVAHMAFLLIYLLHFPLLPTSLLCPSERERERAVSPTLMELPWVHLFALLCYGWDHTSDGSWYDFLLRSHMEKQ